MTRGRSKSNLGDIVQKIMPAHEMQEVESVALLQITRLHRKLIVALFNIRWIIPSTQPSPKKWEDYRDIKGCKYGNDLSWCTGLFKFTLLQVTHFCKLLTFAAEKAKMVCIQVYFKQKNAKKKREN